MRDIEVVFTQVPENFLQLNFEESAYEQETPIGTKQARMFTLYRDGFMLLVMGYTGKKAMQIKITYIMAFNAMQEKLDKLAAEERAALAGNVKAIPQTTTRSTAADRAPLRALVHAWAKITNVHHAALL